MRPKIRFTLSQLERLKKDGKIHDFTYHQLKAITPAGKKVVKHFKKRSVEKEWISLTLFEWCQKNRLDLFEEYRFDKTGEKGFLFDFCMPDINAAVEYEGIFSEKSGHTTITGYTKDVLKYNLALAQGWKVVRLTATNYHNLLDELDVILKNRNGI